MATPIKPQEEYNSYLKGSQNTELLILNMSFFHLYYWRYNPFHWHKNLPNNIFV